MTSDDDTALNNVKMECCKIKNPASTCTPSDSWMPIQECQNQMSNSNFNCEFELKVGISVSDKTVKGSTLETQASASLETSVEGTSGALSASFKASVGYSRTTGYNWQQSQSDTWNTETTRRLKVEIKPGRSVVVEQVVGSCGAFSVGAPIYRTREI